LEPNVSGKLGEAPLLAPREIPILGIVRNPSPLRDRIVARLVMDSINSHVGGENCNVPAHQPARSARRAKTFRIAR
jgi:hypothetical protein